MMENQLPRIIIRKKQTPLRAKGKQNIKDYINGSNIIEKKVGFAIVFTDITKRGVLLEEVSIKTAKMTVIKKALKKIHKIED